MSNAYTTTLPGDDLKLAALVALVVEKRYGYQQIMNWESDIPVECRIVEFAWAATGHAYCEGYVAFMWMECHHRELASCFRELGLPDLAIVVDQMLAPIPKEGVLGNMEALERHFGGWDSFASWAAKFEAKLFEANERIVCAVADYCRAHASSFFHLGPEIEKLLAQSPRSS